MYTDMYETNFDCIICGFDKAFLERSRKLSINEGDTIYLDFQIRDIDQEGYIDLYFYDHEFEDVYTILNISTLEIEDTSLKVILSSELSKAFFPRGLYYCKVVYRYIYDELEIVTTLLNPQLFLISVL